MALRSGITCSLTRLPYETRSSSMRIRCSATDGRALFTTMAAGRIRGLVELRMTSAASTACSAPRRAKNPGSVTMTAQSLALRALRVSSPSEGGQSMSTTSYERGRLARLARSRSEECRPSTVLRCSSARSAASTCTLVPHGECAMASMAMPGRASASTSLMVNGGLSMFRPIVALACGSRSTTSTRWPRAHAALASPKVTEVFPTPPFIETMENVGMGPHRTCQLVRVCRTVA